MIKNNIFVKSRFAFKEIVSELTQEQKNEYSIISIHSPKIGLSFNDTDPILTDSDNVLNLWFHDIDPEQDIEWIAYNPSGQDEVLFDDDMAQKIVEFVKKNESKSKWLIHCTAGICRSGAVGEVLADYFEIPYFEFKKDNPQIKPNIFVKLKLIQAFYGKGN